MEKLELNVNPKEWGNLVTKYSPSSKKVSIADFTDGTVNIDTDFRGSLTKRKGSTVYNSTDLPGFPKDQFEAIFSDGAHHLLVVSAGEIRYSSGDGLFNTVVNGTGFSTGANFEFATTQDRVYGGNAVDDPQVYDRSTSYGGVSYTAPQLKDMGAQAPASAPTVAVVAGGNVPVGSHTYKITFLYYDSEESNGGPASAVATTSPGNQTVNLTAIPIGGYGVTARKIYRDDNDGVWLHLATLTNNTATTYSDMLAAGPTPTPIPTDNNEPPSFGLITLWLDRLWISEVPGDPSTLFYSEPGLPDIFPSANLILCNQEDPITATIVYYDRLIVFNRRSMGQILGKTSDTFRYAAIPSSIGCVDNRTLQIRVIEGVPVLVWLSDRGFYSYDGNSINYISDVIEDLVNFNIQQAVRQKNSNTQTTQTQFQSGISSNGIELTALPGSITTRGYDSGTAFAGTNPRRNWDDEGDWEGGSTQTNINTNDGSNTVKVPTRFAPDESTGQLTDMIVDSGQFKLTTASDFAGELYTFSGNTYRSITPTSGTGFAYAIRPTRSGTLIQFAMSAQLNNNLSFAAQYKMRVWSDSGGNPGTVLFESGTLSTGVFSGTPSTPTPFIVSGVGLTLAANTTYWIGVQFVNSSPSLVTNIYALHPQLFNGNGVRIFISPSWASPTFGGTISGGLGSHLHRWVFCQSAVAKSGQWVSSIYDTFSDNIGPTLNIALTSSLVSGSFCSGSYTSSNSITVEGSDDSLFTGGAEVSEVVNNLNGNQNLSISGKRYWRLRLTLAITDDRATPTAQDPILKFSITGTWISETIDATGDVTDFTALVISDAQPAGTSIVYTVATSNDDITYPDGFVTFGTEVVRRYIKVRAILTATADDITTPALLSIILRWTLTANLISQAIDTAVTPPAGWDIFLADFDTNGGTVQFQLRSASTLLGLTGATFFTVTPGDFPSATPVFQFAQWKVIITSADEDVPVINSVTVQWLISSIPSLRPASIFVDSRYYVALAELEQTVNNVLLELDLNGKWRRHSGLNIATFSFFFNRPYMGMSNDEKVRKFLEGLTDDGDDISFDYRSKAMDYSTDEFDNNNSKVKIVGEVVLEGKNTGAEYAVSYSVDEGQNFFPLLTNNGASSFTTTTDESIFFIRLRPNWNSGNPISGRSIMYRVFNEDDKEVEIHGFKPLGILRQQQPVITG